MSSVSSHPRCLPLSTPPIPLLPAGDAFPFDLENSYSSFSAQAKHFEENKNIPENFQQIVGLVATSKALMLLW